jgi:hypothetical protein
MKIAGWGHACPADSTHGRLIPWPHSPVYGWFCPSQLHDGYRDRPATRAFFTTDEARTGVPISRSAPDLPAPNASRREPARAQIPIPEQMT